jgi:hypothetical protein
MTADNVSILKKPTIKKGTKGAPPPVQDVTPNVQKAPSGKKVQIPIQASPEFRREFKAYCAERDISMSDLFREMFEFWKANKT